MSEIILSAEIIGRPQSNDSNRFYGRRDQQTNHDGTPKPGSWDPSNLPESMRSCPFDGGRIVVIGSQSFRARCQNCARQFGIRKDEVENDVIPLLLGRVYLQVGRDHRRYIVLVP